MGNHNSVVRSFFVAEASQTNFDSHVLVYLRGLEGLCVK
jgi:hypothetical protein